MMKRNSEEIKAHGITGSGALGFYNMNNKGDVNELLGLAMDAAMQTSPNIGIPSVLTSYVNTEVVNVLFNPRNATKIAREVKMGDWTTSTAIFKVAEETGFIAGYNDKSPNGRSDVNFNFPRREQALFQTVIEYGDFEQELTAQAKLNLVARKQKAAANTVAIAANYFYLFGVAGREIYGLLNDPNLNPAITALPTGASGSTKWADKNMLAIYNDIVALFKELVSNQENINQSLKVILAVSPSTNVELARASEYNNSVMDLLNKYFVGGLEVVVLPELDNLNGDNMALMTVRSVLDEEVAITAFGEKYRVFPLVREMSSQNQKIAFSTYGGIVLQPSCVATMTGI